MHATSSSSTKKKQSNNVTNDKVERIMEMGFTREDAISGLEETGLINDAIAKLTSSAEFLPRRRAHASSSEDNPFTSSSSAAMEKIVQHHALPLTKKSRASSSSSASSSSLTSHKPTFKAKPPGLSPSSSVRVKLSTSSSSSTSSLEEYIKTLTAKQIEEYKYLCHSMNTNQSLMRDKWYRHAACKKEVYIQFTALKVALRMKHKHMKKLIHLFPIVDNHNVTKSSNDVIKRLKQKKFIYENWPEERPEHVYTINGVSSSVYPDEDTIKSCSHEDKIGWIYLAHDMIGQTKIGWTASPPNERIWKVENDYFKGKKCQPYPFAWEFWKSSMCSFREEYLHDEFPDKYIHFDEYFQLDLEDKAWIRRTLFTFGL